MKKQPFLFVTSLGKEVPRRVPVSDAPKSKQENTFSLKLTDILHTANSIAYDVYNSRGAAIWAAFFVYIAKEEA